ncbi:MAG: ferrochelatase [Proteobacteria bacterium]|nr:ferrochelatase [Pseudomonadota bacterium]MBU1686007.1 ferrochelatase [Pseudomonadota bacterium]
MVFEHDDQDKIGVVLLNLGGPERLEDVEPFLYNLFSDRKIIRLGPWFMQKFIARRIARKRAPSSRESYRLIGGGSPLARITVGQGAALEELLASHGRFRVGVAMRYWSPSSKQTLAAMDDEGIQRIVALTLYPHYSVATTGSSLEALREAARELPSPPELAMVASWPDQPDYIECLAASIRSGLGKFNGTKVELVYSAHSLPVKFIEEGDPYLDHLQRTIKAIEDRTGLVGRLCFQSRSGPVEWQGPSTPELLAQLSREGCKNALVVPISFVSDHVETLYEVDMLYRDQAHDLGIRLERVESLNLQEGFIVALRELVIEACRKKGWLA